MRKPERHAARSASRSGPRNAAPARTGRKPRAAAADDTPYHHGALRDALLQAAERVLERDGLAGLTLRAVAREAGVSHAAPTHHFGDLTGLVSELAAIGSRQFNQAMAKSCAPDTPFPVRGLARAHAYVGYPRDQQSIRNGGKRRARSSTTCGARRLPGRPARGQPFMWGGDNSEVERRGRLAAHQVNCESWKAKRALLRCRSQSWRLCRIIGVADGAARKQIAAKPQAVDHRRHAFRQFQERALAADAAQPHTQGVFVASMMLLLMFLVYILPTSSAANECCSAPPSRASSS